MNICFVPFDLGNTARGQRDVLGAIRNCESHDGKLNPERSIPSVLRGIEELRIPSLPPLGGFVDDAEFRAKNLSLTARCFSELRPQIEQFFDKKGPYVILSGDHTVAGLTLPLLRKRRGDFKTVWIDAHGDLNTPGTSLSGNMHGMSASMACGLADSEISPQELAMWQQLLPEQPLSLRDFTYLGLRLLDEGESSRIASHSVKVFDVSSVTHGLETICASLISTPFFIEFDIDSIDPSDLGTGAATPVPGGLGFATAKTLLQTLLKSPNCLGIEIVEFCPHRDTDGRTIRCYYEILQLVRECLGI